jgi:hypothetical protein
VVARSDATSEYSAGSADAVIFLYGERCFPDDGDEAGRCNYDIQIWNYALCDRYAGMIDGHRRSIRVDGLPGHWLPQIGRLMLYTRETTVEVEAPSLREAVTVARRLRLVNPARGGQARRSQPYRGDTTAGRPEGC